MGNYQEWAKLQREFKGEHKKLAQAVIDRRLSKIEGLVFEADEVKATDRGIAFMFGQHEYILNSYSVFSSPISEIKRAVSRARDTYDRRENKRGKLQHHWLKELRSSGEIVVCNSQSELSELDRFCEAYGIRLEFDRHGESRAFSIYKEDKNGSVFGRRTKS